MSNVFSLVSIAFRNLLVTMYFFYSLHFELALGDARFKGWL